ncbi:MAG: recombinase family protein [Propionibacteriaceae bacterium]|nr:recombinase family protein [Propionibacteriaceae bacterium]
MPKTSTATLPQPLADLGATATMAVMYLRVSTKEQATRGGREEGFSIPAQREANLRKATELGAVVVEEFVEAGESAKTADRPALQAMIEYVKSHQVAYCIVHKIDRLARNRADDVHIHLALKQAGVTLVSATESIDETPSGMLVHGIMATIAEFYSRNLAAEVSKGMTVKASIGGTNGKAPLGYINTRKRDELGRDVAAVDIDPERAPLVQWAFQAYATGNYSIVALREELADRGLTRLPTPKRPAGIPSVSAIHKMLSNPYYKGDVVFRDAVYDGLHPALVEPDLWYRVQTVLQGHNIAKDKTQIHSHYLKGTLYCKDCASRLILCNAKSHTGTIYPYFVCAGKHTRRTDCTRRSMPVDRIEAKIEDLYRQITIPAHVASALRHLLTDEFDKLYAQARTDKGKAERDRAGLMAERKQLLQAHYAGAVPLDLLKEEQDRITRRLDLLEAQIGASKEIYENAKAHLDDVLQLAANAYDLYTSLGEADRRLCNQAFFTKIWVSEVDTLTGVPTHGFELVLDPDIQQLALHHEADPQTGVGDLQRLVLAQGSNMAQLVGPTGFEPATPCKDRRVFSRSR